MTVWQITVDGIHDHLTDLSDPQPWLDAARQVERALAGRERHVEATAQPGLTCDVNPMVIFTGQQIAKEDRT